MNELARASVLGVQSSGSPTPGDPAAALEQFRPALMGHCYRMLGSVVDADDAVQEAMVRAWRGIERLERESALRAWLYQIATNVCLDLLADRKRRARPMDQPHGTPDTEMVELPHGHWLEPIPDAAFLASNMDPHERAVLRERTRLAFVAALQHLPPKQRAAYLMAEVLGCSAAEVASSLELSVAAVNSALQRARAKLPVLTDEPVPLSDEQNALLERYVAAFERFDVAEITALLRDDATYSMPPWALWLRGPEMIRAWLSKWPGDTCRGSRLVPTSACGSPAFGQYRPQPDGSFAPWALIVLELGGACIAGVNIFHDTATLFPRFGLAPTLTI